VSSTYTRSLDQLRRDDESSFGGKSASLGELLAAQIPVPPGFALSTAAYSEFAAQPDVAAAISAGAADPIAEAMRGGAMPAGVLDEIAGAYAALGEPPVAVRSSAIGEDSEEATFAGQQETFLWVQGTDQVCEAVRNCWISLYSPTAVSYRARLGGEREAAMGVTVQEMVDAEISGVMFTCNPVSGDPSMVAVNASWGLGLAVVGGEVTPDDYLVSKVTREVVRAQVNDKHHEYVPDPDGRGAIRRDVEDERRTARCLDEDALATLVDVAKRVERHFGSRQDIEWAIARGTSARDGLYLLQSRPVTGVEGPKPKPAPSSAIAAVMTTFGANVKRGGK
jgi:phosphoenolpyruvate synthase/pyruvate phosphate dikinase